MVLSITIYIIFDQDDMESRERVIVTGGTGNGVGGTNLNLINAKSRDDCVHKGLR